jgi:tetratricopeptide (TPR) repeat protein
VTHRRVPNCSETATVQCRWQAAYNLGQLLLRAGRTAEAAQQFEAVVATNAEFAGGYIYLAKARLDGGDLAAAKRAADQGLARRPAPSLEVFGRYLLADVYSRSGRAEASDREADAARRLEAELRLR